jgi:hypothetical protein
MSDVVLDNGQRVFYEYDPVQDMLYILLREHVGPTYYEDVPNNAGVMLRYDAATDKVVGVTVHNVQKKLMQRLIGELGERVLPKAA